MKSRNPTLTSPMTPSTRATISLGRWRENNDTATVHVAIISTHSSSEPSCEPQDAATLYAVGSRVLAVSKGGARVLALPAGGQRDA